MADGINGAKMNGNRFGVLAKNGVANESEDGEISFKVKEVVKGAMEELTSSREVPEDRKALVEDVVSAVVAAMLPIIAHFARGQKSSKIETEVQRHEFRLDEQEQLVKMDNLIIGGIDERDGEDVIATVIEVAADVGVALETNDLSCAERMGFKRQNGKPRSILARFVRRNKRQSLIQARRNLKSVKKDNGQRKYEHVFIGDDLTKLRQTLLKKLKNDDTIEEAWSYDGKVFCKKKGNDKTKYAISSPESLFRLGWSEEKIRDTGLYLAFE